MKRPKPVRNVDAEVTHWSDDISGEVVLEIVTALRKRLRRVDRNHDIPYLAGYSRDGRTVFIDRHMPRSFLVGKRRVRTDSFLITHEGAIRITPRGSDGGFSRAFGECQTSLRQFRCGTSRPRLWGAPTWRLRDMANLPKQMHPHFVGLFHS